MELRRDQKTPPPASTLSAEETTPCHPARRPEDAAAPSRRPLLTPPRVRRREGCPIARMQKKEGWKITRTLSASRSVSSLSPINTSPHDPPLLIYPAVRAKPYISSPIRLSRHLLLDHQASNVSSSFHPAPYPTTHHEDADTVETPPDAASQVHRRGRSYLTRRPS